MLKTIDSIRLKSTMSCSIVVFSYCFVNLTFHEETNKLVAVMGTQSLQGITLIRHAYVSTARRNCGIGGQMLSFLQGTIDQPLLIGTWADAVWAIDFYKKYGFQQVPQQEKNRLLKQYWTISDRQIETSVVLADKKWLNSAPVKRSQEGT